jgi:hypothetical protein
LLGRAIDPKAYNHDAARLSVDAMKKQTKRKRSAAHAIADLIGSVDGLPADLSARRGSKKGV